MTTRIAVVSAVLPSVLLLGSLTCFHAQAPTPNTSVDVVPPMALGMTQSGSKTPKKQPHPPHQIPKTVDDAVVKLKTEWLSPTERDWILRTPRDQAVATLHLPFGTAVRNSFKLWGGNPELIASCGVTDPEECSAIIFDRLWQSLRADADPGLVRQLDCQFKLIEKIDINYKGFGNLTIEKMLDVVQQQIDQQMDRMAKSGVQLCQTSLRLEPTGDPNLKCFVRAEFSNDKSSHTSLDRFWGWIGWRNAFEVLNDPPSIRLRFDNKCAWPQRPHF